MQVENPSKGLPEKGTDVQKGAGEGIIGKKLAYVAGGAGPAGWTSMSGAAGWTPLGRQE